MVSIEEIREIVRAEGEKIQAPSSLLTIASRSRGDGSPHVELSGSRYNYVVSERGQEFSRKSTGDLDELLFWIFSDIASSMAQKKCSTIVKRVGEDPRRCVFQEKIDLLKRINEDWALEEEKNINLTLKRSPIDDFVNVRMNYCKDLIDQGFEESVAYQKALEKYPEP